MLFLVIEIKTKFNEKIIIVFDNSGDFSTLKAS